MADMPSFPMNRARYRELDAKMRRLSKRLDCKAGCDTSGKTAAGGDNLRLIDQLTAGTESGSLKYSGAVAAVGFSLSMPEFQNAHKQRELPVLLRRVTTLSGLLGLYVTDQPREQWRSTLSQITSFKIADQTMALSKMMKLPDEEAIPAALTLVLLQGALADRIGEKNDLSVGYRRAMSVFESSMETLQKEAGGSAPGSKLSGLGILNINKLTQQAAQYGGQAQQYAAQQQAAGLRTPSRAKVDFAKEIPSDIPADVKPGDVFDFAVQFANNRDSSQFLNDSTKAAPGWIAADKKNAFRLAAFAVSRLPDLNATGINREVAWRQWAAITSTPGNLSVDNLAEWAANPPAWQKNETSSLGFGTAFGSALTNLILGFQKSRGLNICNQPLRSDAEWITESCGTFNTSEFRARKIEIVNRAWKTAFPGRPIDNCTINYYTQFKWCSEDTFVGEMKIKEAAGRPELKQEERERGDGPFLKWIKENLGPAIDWIIIKVKELASKAAELLCKAFKAVFPDPVGGILCRIFEIILGTVSAVVTTVFFILKTVLIGLGEFFVAIFKGDLKGAALALVQMVNSCVIAILGGASGLFTGTSGIATVEAELTPADKAAGMVSLEGLGQQLSKTHPTFTLTLIFSVLGVIFGGPTPVAIAALITCLAPAVALIVVPILKRNIPELKDSPNEKLALGTETVVKIVGMVVGFVLSINDVFQKFSGALERYWLRLRAQPGAELTKLSKGFSDNFAKKWNELKAACNNGNLRSISDAIKAFFKFFPDLLIALGDPDITSIAEEGRKLVAGSMSIYAQAQATWDQAMASYKNDVERMDALKKQIDEFQKQLDVLCAMPANKSQPVCQKPPPQEKIVYVDSKGGTATVTQKPPAPATGTPAASYRPPAYTPPPKAPAKKGGAAGPLALATGGFLVGGPIGAAAGLVIGIAAGR